MPDVVGEYIDQICSIELRPNGGNIPRGVTRNLYEAARAKVDGPLSTRMAQALVGRVGAGDNVLIVTGAGGEPYLPHAEIDGLLGAAAIARALTLGLGAQVHIAVEANVVNSIRQVLVAAELSSIVAGERMLPQAVTVQTSPISAEDSEREAARLLAELRPAAVIAIEKLSECPDGKIRGSTGFDWDDIHFKPRFLFNAAREQGVLTCGIGDCGNEVGFGSVPEVATIMPAGEIMRSTVVTDHLLVAGVSNWGGYALNAMIAFLVDRPDLLTGPDMIEAMMRAAVAAGSWDGLYNRPVLCDDGIPLSAHRALGELVATAVRQGLLRDIHSPSH